MGINIYNSLPTYIKKELTDMKKFVSLTRNFLSENSFYSLEEFYNFCKMEAYYSSNIGLLSLIIIEVLQCIKNCRFNCTYSGILNTFKGIYIIMHHFY